MPWCKKIVDDILIWATTPSELEARINQVVQRCEDLHVTLSKSKFHIDSSLNLLGVCICIRGYAGSRQNVCSGQLSDSL